MERNGIRKEREETTARPIALIAQPANFRASALGNAGHETGGGKAHTVAVICSAFCSAPIILTHSFRLVTTESDSVRVGEKVSNELRGGGAVERTLEDVVDHLGFVQLGQKFALQVVLGVEDEVEHDG